MKAYILTADGASSLWLWTASDGVRKILNAIDHELARNSGAVEREVTLTQLKSMGGS